MELREKLRRQVLKKEYENFPGVQFKKVLLPDEYTKNEDRELEYLTKTFCIPNDRVDTRCDREYLKTWLKEKVTPYLGKGNNVVFMDGGFGVNVTILDTEKMLDFYLNSKSQVGLCIINRSLKKLLDVSPEENDYAFFIRDI
ncbi:hypothetical protein ACZ11_04510 [Lysinibacillus xylanilyticus]|uniref:Uncharacterized protein n=1 Tax=Lysinibacillus xylanilyticus TaxID=582475 RepID=A0A0K9FBC9_9BACI|nr:hypothetical protein [Lysinibacillus xylanilyticus]KMY31498.1 hypothetical protein ACZ11_04510 [Lysinibacillus xylanilyticus]